ncbi:hypothetical protein CHS0354_001134 [Potamilus streckersoni]|uniref:Uncharacterized protein n=1 Tax=Potamilus streckersoni TaxID=2493646 RepID=A0AAE0SYM5_9BIVA|nr:hypothetical protein CHS0354_001134 [Potamilus streckersoni]
MIPMEVAELRLEKDLGEEVLRKRKQNEIKTIGTKKIKGEENEKLEDSYCLNPNWMTVQEKFRKMRS